ncbi:MAG: threonine/serine dehydratase [Alphaproteobacteria bacterium]|nr:threonine/serine dehydratase [Alphaproteobacteria bacterium]
MSLTYDDFLKAQRDLVSITSVTPLMHSPSLSTMIEGNVFLKLENTQITHSFKARGAYIKLRSLSDEDKKRGVVAVSAGNHAKAVAYHCKSMGISAIVVMPNGTPSNKIKACEALGVQIVFHGRHLAEAFVKGEEIAKKKNMTLIHPYEDPLIVAGQGTIGIELVEQHRKPLDAVIIPVGGGGLAAGIGRVLSARWPLCEIYGVQSEFAPEMAEKLFLYRSSTAKPDITIAEGIAVKKPGVYTSDLLNDVLLDIFVVPERGIKQAIVHLLIHDKQVVEGAGAAGVAALMENKHVFYKKNVGIILCGGNVDNSLLVTLLTA